jgi:hypothetical protein
VKYVCNNVLHGYAETWTVGENEEKFVNTFETWCWRRILKIKWTDRTTNCEVCQRSTIWIKGREKTLTTIFKTSRHVHRS